MSKLTRRDFLKIVGAGSTIALGIPFVSCKPSREHMEKVVSQLIPAEEIVPGIPLWYATTCTECPANCGLLLKTREGRVIKVEGNPDHPVNKGSHCMWGESALQALYNPDRLKAPLLKDKDGKLQPITWDRALEVLVQKFKENKDKKIAWLTPLLSGSLERLISSFSKKLGDVRIVQYEPLTPENLIEASEKLFGIQDVPHLKFDEVDLVISFGADFLGTWVSPVEYAKSYAARRVDTKNRLYHIQLEPRMSLTGGNADKWISLKPGTEHLVSGLLLKRVIEKSVGSANIPGEIHEWVKKLDENTVINEAGISKEDFEFILKRLLKAKKPLILGKGQMPGDPAGTASWIASLSLTYILSKGTPPFDYSQSTVWGKAIKYKDLKRFVEGWGQDTDMLLVYRSNPVYSLPGFLRASDRLKAVKFIVVFSEFLDETAELADLVLPIRHPFEDWGDANPKGGLWSVQQPGMQPVPHFDSKPFGDLVIEIGKKMGFSLAPNYLEFIKDTWKTVQRKLRDGKDFDEFWRETLQKGVVVIPSQRERTLRFKPSDLPPIRRLSGIKEPLLVVYPSQRLYDGKFANRPWLQEVPDPLVKVSWQSVVEIHPDDAKRWGLKEGDIVQVSISEKKAELPVRLYPRLSSGTVAIATGNGHTSYGRYAKGKGVNAFSLLIEPENGVLQWDGISVSLRKTGKHVPIAHTDGAMTMAGRKVYESIPLSEYREKEHEIEPTYEEEFEKEFPATAAFYKEYHKEKFKENIGPYHWTLVVDLERCTGCSACMVACMAENNIPVVGEKLIARGREMFWIRIERYFDENSNGVHFIPMMCQQCDNAPCEPVCPVFATHHDKDGLNEQVYNRCVGTRYCSNNCPYKVRRFNWFTFKFPEPLNWQLNPDVTVREKGVMEKCTFCIQRIKFAKDRAKDEKRLVRDGEIIPACVQACPTEALVFGNSKDPNSRVSKLIRNPRRYRVLEYLNTRPSVTYLKEFSLTEEEGKA